MAAPVQLWPGAWVVPGEVKAVRTVRAQDVMGDPCPARVYVDLNPSGCVWADAADDAEAVATADRVAELLNGLAEGGA